MSKQCIFTGKKVSVGGSYTRRGRAKYLGGVGRKVTGSSKRKFKPNLQRVRAVIDGKVQRVWVSTQTLRSGLVVKPIKRKPFELPSL